MAEKRNINLDVIRLMACIAVVGLHTFKCDISCFNSVLYYLCGYAIPVFFMSSGYILLNRNKIEFQYCVNKAFNILGVVIAWNTLLFIAKFIYKLIFAQYMTGVSELFFMIGGSLIQKNTMSHFWYMGSLIIVYFFVYILSKFKLNEKGKITIWICFAIISVCIQTYSLIVGYSVQENIIQTFRLWTYFQYFLLGGIMPIFMQYIQSKIALRFHIILVIIMSIIVPAYGIINTRLNPHAEYLYDDIIVVIWVILLFSLIMRIHVSEKTARLTRRLVPYTMGVYIIHILVIKILVHFIPLNSFLSSCVVFTITLSASFAVSFCINKVPVLCRLIKL